MNNRSQSGRKFSCLLVLKNEEVFVYKPQTEETDKDTLIFKDQTYTFDHVYGPHTSPKAVYDRDIHHIVLELLNGNNGTVFVYGPTSSETMEGEIMNTEKMGIIPRVIRDIFNSINTETAMVKVAYLGICARIVDRFNPSNGSLQIREDNNRVPYVKGVTWKIVSNPADVFKLKLKGDKNRMDGRGHNVLQIQVEQQCKNEEQKLSATLSIVYLAGSEMIRKTKAEGVLSEDAKTINKSLSALIRVNEALSKPTKGHVPYRDSKLTRVLEGSLSGNSRNAIVFCCSPDSNNAAETQSALNLAQKFTPFGIRTRANKNGMNHRRTGGRTPNSVSSASTSSAPETPNTHATNDALPTLSESMFATPQNSSMNAFHGSVVFERQDSEQTKKQKEMVSRSTQTSQLDSCDLQLAGLLQAQDGLINKCKETLNTLTGEICRSKKFLDDRKTQSARKG